MTSAQLVVRNAMRNRRRSLLTAASVAVSVFLLAVFGATYRYVSAPPMTSGSHLVLMVGSSSSMMVPLPLHYGERIRRLPGVEVISPVNMVDGYFGSEDRPRWAMACDPEALFTVFNDWELGRAERQAFVADPIGVIAGRATAERLRWKVGDRLHLRSSNYYIQLELVLRGIYRSPTDESLLAFHWDYLNRALGQPDTPGGFWVMARRPEDVPRLMREIDAEFRNQPVQTRTQTMQQLVLSMINLLGNVRAILLLISGAVVFAVLLVVANSVSMSIRERTSEIALMRALGFRRGRILAMLLAESLALTLAGAAAGCLSAAALFAGSEGFRLGGPMPLHIQLDPWTTALAFAVAALVSLLSTVVPGWRASSVEVAEGLRFIG